MIAFSCSAVTYTHIQAAACMLVDNYALKKKWVQELGFKIFLLTWILKCPFINKKECCINCCRLVRFWEAVALLHFVSVIGPILYHLNLQWFIWTIMLNRSLCYLLTSEFLVGGNLNCNQTHLIGSQRSMELGNMENHIVDYFPVGGPNTTSIWTCISNYTNGM